MARALGVGWWNLQNYFDTDDDPIADDFEYTPARGWTPSLFEFKRSQLAAVLRAMDAARPLDLLAVCEVEQDELLADLLTHAGLARLEVVRDPAGTSDLRGIDVALAVDPARLAVERVRSHVVSLRYATRDILEVSLRERATGTPLVVIASHWPSRGLGRYRSEPLRAAVAEQIAYLVQDHVKLAAREYLDALEADDIARVQARWETPVLILGDFNDEPADRSVTEHLRASRELDRVRGETNDIDGFRSAARYRGQEVFLYNPMWPHLARENVGTYYLDALRSGEKFANRYQVLDQLVVSRGLLGSQPLQLDLGSVAIFADPLVATRSGRPRRFRFDRDGVRAPSGVSDHLPVLAAIEVVG